MLKKVFNWSEVHLSEMTCYKIHTLIAYCSNVDLKLLLVVTVAQLKVLTVPVAPVKNCRHPAGPPISFSLLFKQ